MFALFFLSVVAELTQAVGKINYHFFIWGYLIFSHPAVAKNVVLAEKNVVLTEKNVVLTEENSNLKSTCALPQRRVFSSETLDGSDRKRHKNENEVRSQ
jgi:hypothetical protein